MENGGRRKKMQVEVIGGEGEIKKSKEDRKDGEDEGQVKRIGKERGGMGKENKVMT